MERCVFILGDSCVSSNDILATVFGVGIVLILLGVYLYRYWNPSSNDDGIQITDMNFQRSVPSTEAAEKYVSDEGDGMDGEEYDEYDHPAEIGERLFAGEYEKLGASLEIIKYIEDPMEVHCRLWVEVPEGSTDVLVRHTWEGEDNDLGAALVHYTLAGQAEFAVINLFQDDLNDSNYVVVINVGKSTNEDITE